MTLQKQNPLPPGRYWVDVNGVQAMAEAQAWFKNMATLQRVHVEATEHSAPGTTLGSALPNVLATGGEVAISDWYLFQVLPVIPGQPDLVIWDTKRLGFVTIAGPEIHSKADTVSRPDLPLDPTDQIDPSKFLGEAKTLLEVLIGGVVLLGVAVVISKK